MRCCKVGVLVADNVLYCHQCVCYVQTSRYL